MSTPYVGEIRLFGFPRIPTGWFACNGDLYAISDYEALYSLIGTTYGGNGTTNFAVPDLRGRLPVHQGTGGGLSPAVLGQSYGTETVTLLTTQIPTHNHMLLASQAAGSTSTPGTSLYFANVSPDVWYYTAQGAATAETMNPAVIGQTGNSLPHDNCMPTLTGSYCIAWAGVFPSQS
jgi:microcystin-dependent protein